MGQSIRRLCWERSIQVDHINCLECGQSLQLLSHRHLVRHGLTPQSYKHKYGIPQTQALISKSLYSRRRQLSYRLHTSFWIQSFIISWPNIYRLDIKELLSWLSQQMIRQLNNNRLCMAANLWYCGCTPSSYQAPDTSLITRSSTRRVKIFLNWNVAVLLLGVFEAIVCYITLNLLTTREFSRRLREQ